MNSERVYRTEAVVLRRHDFGEADRVLTLYSPVRGKVRALAKGVRRPRSRLGGHVELFTHCRLLVAQGRSLDIVTQAETVRPFHHIRDDLWKAAYACYAAELVDRFTEERLENQPVFDLLLGIFAALDGLGAPAAPDVIRETPGASLAGIAELAVRQFELRLLFHLGYAPELHRCVQCGTPLDAVENRFSPAGGGVLCPSCAVTHPGALPVSVNAIKALRLFSREPFGLFQRLRVPGDVATEVEGATRAHINYVLERQLRTSEFLDRLRSDLAHEQRAARRRAIAG
jgi:DNA repair protein RecO (recombination protein O)